MAGYGVGVGVEQEQVLTQVAGDVIWQGCQIVGFRVGDRGGAHRLSVGDAVVRGLCLAGTVGIGVSEVRGARGRWVCHVIPFSRRWS